MGILLRVRETLVTVRTGRQAGATVVPAKALPSGRTGAPAGASPGPASQYFFAPARIASRMRW